jgi:uncharacterized protein YsxB (DUF464 family)
MIEITYSRKDGGHRLSLKGHAGFAECGQDIVCAGVSAITFALLSYLELVGAQHKKDMRSGYTICCCERNQHTDIAFSVAITGLELIAGSYPENVSVTNNAATGG